MEAYPANTAIFYSSNQYIPQLLSFVPLAPPSKIVSSQDQGPPIPLVLNCIVAVLSPLIL
ncbi:unnamed protein product [Staurois parvus]|uniref:Uncharacterized protein n=1 Tax=Staurois parvus TaxID=386267 RepID=A0ABN9EEP0_9NEOB|nr:unnamed protein product [Staurois parvus]